MRRVPYYTRLPTRYVSLGIYIYTPYLLFCTESQDVAALFQLERNNEHLLVLTGAAAIAPVRMLIFVCLSKAVGRTEPRAAGPLLRKCLNIISARGGRFFFTNLRQHAGFCFAQAMRLSWCTTKPCLLSRLAVVSHFVCYPPSVSPITDTPEHTYEYAVARAMRKEGLNRGFDNGATL